MVNSRLTNILLIAIVVLLAIDIGFHAVHRAGRYTWAGAHDGVTVLDTETGTVYYTTFTGGTTFDSVHHSVVRTKNPQGSK